MNILLRATFVLIGFACSAKAIKVFGSFDELPLELRHEASLLIPAFEQIESYLNESQSIDAETLVTEMKKLSLKLNKSGLFAKLRSDNPERRLLKRALALLTSLPEAAKSCDFNGYNILAQNHVAVKADDKTPDDGSRKILKVVRSFALKHATYCRPKYESLYFDSARALELKDRTSYGTVEQIFRRMTPNKCLLDPTASEPRMTDECAADLVDELVVLAKEHRRLNLETDRFERVMPVVDDLLQSVLLVSCQVHNEHLRDVFAPAIYDATIEDEAQRELLYPDRGTFSEGLQRFRGCQYIVSKKHELDRLILKAVARRNI